MAEVTSIPVQKFVQERARRRSEMLEALSLYFDTDGAEWINVVKPELDANWADTDTIANEDGYPTITVGELRSFVAGESSINSAIDTIRALVSILAIREPNVSWAGR